MDLRRIDRRWFGFALCLVLIFALARYGLSQEDRTYAEDAARNRDHPLLQPSENKGVEPVVQALSQIPLAATDVTFLDVERLEDNLGVPDLSSDSAQAERDDFWAAAAATQAVLEAPVLRTGGDLEDSYGFTQEDVRWEAQFQVNGKRGFVIALDPQIPAARVERATQGAGPLRGADVLPDQAEQPLVTKHAVDDIESSWASRDDRLDLVQPNSVSMSLHDECVSPAQLQGTDVTTLSAYSEIAQTAGYSVSFNQRIATIRVGARRGDTRQRAVIGEAVGDFTRAFGSSPVVESSEGRIGYRVDDIAAAVAAARSQNLPPAVCSAS